ncbi:MAG: DUF3795 domain-containing protein [Methanomassiliicoccales archaeon]|nr:DUF3795 domain-containing protein [Methanomassiliicoccales archaeon]
MNIIIGVCGNDCENCSHFGSLCDGCSKEMSSSFTGICEAYRCAMNRGIALCEECIEFNDCTTVLESKILCPLIIEKITQRDIHSINIPDSAH